MLTQTQKGKLIKKFRTHESDTGSTEVQIAILSEEIERLADHLKKHPKDFHSKRGLLKMVAKRKKLLEWLKRGDEKRYTALAKTLGIKIKETLDIKNKEAKETKETKK